MLFAGGGSIPALGACFLTMKMSLTKLLLASALCLSVVAACSRPPGVGLSGNNPPIFTFSGSDKLWVFEVYEVRRSDSGGECLCLVWGVADNSEKQSLDELGSIKYGEVPQGWKQVYPPNGTVPPFAPEQNYQYWMNIDGNVEVMRDLGIYDARLTHTLKE